MINRNTTCLQKGALIGPSSAIRTTTQYPIHCFERANEILRTYIKVGALLAVVNKRSGLVILLIMSLGPIYGRCSTPHPQFEFCRHVLFPNNYVVFRQSLVVIEPKLNYRRKLTMVAEAVQLLLLTRNL